VLAAKDFGLFSLWLKRRRPAAKPEDIGFGGGDPMSHSMSLL